MLPGARTLPIPTTTADIVVLGFAGLFHGWSLYETTGSAAASAIIRDGSGTDGAVIAAINLAQGVSDTKWLAGSGVVIRTGLYLDMISGSIAGALWALPVTHDSPFLLAEGARSLWSGHE